MSMIQTWFTCPAGLLWPVDLSGIHGVRHAGDHREGAPRRHGLHQARAHPLHRLRRRPHHHGKHPSHLARLLILHPLWLLKFDLFLYDVIHCDG